MISGVSLVGDGVAGRFLEEEVGQKIWAKKEALLSGRRTASLLYTRRINGGVSVALGQSGTMVCGQPQ